MLSTNVLGVTLAATRTLLPSDSGHDVEKSCLAKSVATSNLECVSARITVGLLTDSEIARVGFKTVGTGKLQ